MSAKPAIAEFLDDYGRALARLEGAGPLLRRRIVAEARGHLQEAAAALEAAGRDPAAAAAEAVRRFGGPEELAAAWRGRLAAVFAGLAARRREWIALSAAGSALGVAAALLAGPAVAPFLPMILLLPAVGLVLGCSLGAAQGVLLHWRPARLAAWVLASGAAIGAGLTATSVVVEALGFEKGAILQDLAALLIVGAGTGAALGGSQWPFLSRRLARGVGWVPRTAVGMASGILLGGFRTTAGLLALALAGGAMAAAATAAAFRHPASPAAVGS
ncbi:MAG TPA: permease prefix domain 1-containing protein [Thermoanaerobaculia bacterium]|nr:permease prefix domain 1-containing protein [Thermoanaerobaculia bacterium]